MPFIYESPKTEKTPCCDADAKTVSGPCCDKTGATTADPSKLCCDAAEKNVEAPEPRSSCCG